MPTVKPCNSSCFLSSTMPRIFLNKHAPYIQPHKSLQQSPMGVPSRQCMKLPPVYTLQVVALRDPTHTTGWLTPSAVSGT